jgi:hypothetical protein
LFQNPVGFGQLLKKPAKSPVSPLNPEKLFQKPKFWNSLIILFFDFIHKSLSGSPLSFQKGAAGSGRGGQNGIR